MNICRRPQEDAAAVRIKNHFIVYVTFRRDSIDSLAFQISFQTSKPLFFLKRQEFDEQTRKISSFEQASDQV